MGSQKVLKYTIDGMLAEGVAWRGHPCWAGLCNAALFEVSHTLLKYKPSSSLSWTWIESFSWQVVGALSPGSCLPSGCNTLIGPRGQLLSFSVM